jgi:hypothetical protein
MLTDIALKALKPKEKIYKVADRDGVCSRDAEWRDLVSPELQAQRPPGAREVPSTRGAPLAKDGHPR